jgi:hypothetical protein
MTEDIKGEVAHFGSPYQSNLSQPMILVHVHINEQENKSQPILTPWLGVNYKVSYFSDQTKEMLYSLGLT